MSLKELLNSFVPVDIANNRTTQNLAIASQVFERYFLYGGFPKAFIDQDVQILQQYYKDILHKDIIPRVQSNRSREFSELGSFLLSNYSNLTNKTKLAGNIGIKQPRTINRYISSFLDAYLFYEIKMFSPSLKKQTRSLSKFYTIDHALAKATSFNVLDNRSVALENMVFIELKRRGYELFYWQTQKSNWQVDFIARKPGNETLAVQVCLNINDPKVSEREIRALITAKRELGINRLLLIVEENPASGLNNSNEFEIISFLEWILT